MKVTVKQPFPFNGKTVQPGDVVDIASAHELKALEARGAVETNLPEEKRGEKDAKPAK